MLQGCLFFYNSVIVAYGGAGGGGGRGNYPFGKDFRSLQNKQKKTKLGPRPIRKKNRKTIIVQREGKNVQEEGAGREVGKKMGRERNGEEDGEMKRRGGKIDMKHRLR